MDIPIAPLMADVCVESEQHNQLPYLDVLVTKSVDKFETTVFRKKN